MLTTNAKNAMNLTFNSLYRVLFAPLACIVSAISLAAESFESVCVPEYSATAQELTPVRRAALKQLITDTPTTELCALAELYVPNLRRDYLYEIVQKEILARARPESKEVDEIVDTVDTVRTEPTAAKVSDITIVVEGDESESQEEMAKLRDAINSDQADFEQAARTRSVSSTRFRGGSAGFVRVQTMDPVLAQHISEDKCDGTVQGPIVVGNHISLIRCTDFRDEKVVSPDRARQKATEIATRRNSRKLMTELLGANAEMQTLTLPQLEILSSRLFPDGLAIPDQTIQLSAEAEARLRTQVLARYTPPPMSYVESQYGKYKARHIFPAQFDFDILRFPVSAVSRETILSVERRFVSGELPIEKAAEEISDSQLQRLLLDQDQIFLLGVAIEESLKAMPIGSRSDLLQDKDTAYFIVLHGRTPARQKSLEEAEQLIRQRYANAAMHQIRRQLESELLAEMRNAGGAGQGE